MSILVLFNAFKYCNSNVPMDYAKQKQTMSRMENHSLKFVDFFPSKKKPNKKTK